MNFAKMISLQSDHPLECICSCRVKQVIPNPEVFFPSSYTSIYSASFALTRILPSFSRMPAIPHIYFNTP